MKYTKHKRLIKYLFAVASAVTLMVSMCVIASAEETKNFDSTGFVSCVEGYDASIATEQLNQEGAVQTFPFYETNGDVRDTSNKRWRTVFNDGRYRRYSVDENSNLELIDSLIDPDNEFRYAIDFDQVKSSFDSLGEVTNVHIVYDFAIRAHLVFGSVNGKEYIVPFFTRPDLNTLNSGTAYSSEEVISLINETVKNGNEAAEGAGQPVFGGGGDLNESALTPFFAEMKWVPIAIVAVIILLIGGVAAVVLTKKQKAA